MRVPSWAALIGVPCSAWWVSAMRRAASCRAVGRAGREEATVALLAVTDGAAGAGVDSIASITGGHDRSRQRGGRAVWDRFGGPGHRLGGRDSGGLQVRGGAGEGVELGEEGGADVAPAQQEERGDGVQARLSVASGQQRLGGIQGEGEQPAQVQQPGTGLQLRLGYAAQGQEAQRDQEHPRLISARPSRQALPPVRPPAEGLRSGWSEVCRGERCVDNFYAVSRPPSWSRRAR